MSAEQQSSKTRGVACIAALKSQTFIAFSERRSCKFWRGNILLPPLPNPSPSKKLLKVHKGLGFGKLGLDSSSSWYIFNTML